MSHLTDRLFWAILLGLAMSACRCSAQRSVRASDISLSPDQTNCLPILLQSSGDENALGFSLCYDPNLLTFVSALRGSDASGASWSVNTSQASSGRLGVELVLPAGEVFAEGANTILQVCFRAVSPVSTVLTRVSLCDAPVGREVLDLDAGPLAATYSDATVTVLGVCAYALETSQASFFSDGGVGAIEVTAGAECVWSVVNETSWIGITPPTNGIGNGSVSYTVESNPLPDSRTAVLRIGGEAFTVKQSGTPCTYALEPTNRVHTCRRPRSSVSRRPASVIGSWSTPMIGS